MDRHISLLNRYGLARRFFVRPLLKLSVPVLFIAALFGCDSQSQSAIEHLNLPGEEDAGYPFSSAVKVGNTLYLSGVIGTAEGSNELVGGGIEAETRASMENIKRTVEYFGSSMDRVAKCTVFLADMAEWPAMNAVYRTYFTRMPARSAFAATGLALGARVEIECIAVL